MAITTRSENTPVLPGALIVQEPAPTSLSRTQETLYAVAWIMAEDERDPYDDDVLREMDEAEHFEPEGWREYALEMWPDGPREGEYWPNGYKPFFWPSDKRLYTTRKAAEGRRDLINRWGGNAVVVVAEIDWVPLDVMDARWKHEALLRKRDAVLAELGELERTMSRAEMSNIVTEIGPRGAQSLAQHLSENLPRPSREAQCDGVQSK